MPQNFFWRSLLAFAPFLVLAVFAWFYAGTPKTEADSGVPGDGYAATDDCAYITGVSNDPNGFSDNGGLMDFDNVTDAYQACASGSGATTGYFLGTDFAGDPQESFGWNGQFGWLDFAWDTTGTGDVYIDPVKGEWRGYAWNEKIGWVWFDWTCASCTAFELSTYRVKTDLNTGNVTGYAWNDSIGWIPFYGLRQELAPKTLTAYVDIYARPSGVGPSLADLKNAPLADGYEYFQIRVRFRDNKTGAYMTKTDFSSVGVTPVETTDSLIYLDQVHNTGNAVMKSALNPSVLGCKTVFQLGSYGSCANQASSGATWDFNSYVFSGAPSSSLLGIDSDGTSLDGIVSFFTDRAGCLEIYSGSPVACPGETGAPTKGDTYFSRSIDRNAFYLDKVIVAPVLADPTRDVIITNLVEQADGKYVYDIADYGPTSELKFKPRYVGNNFSARFPISGGEQLDYIQSYSSTTESPQMKLEINGLMNLASVYFGTATGLNRRAPFESYVQLDDDHAIEPISNGDYRLLMDVSQPLSNTLNGRFRSDSIPSWATLGAYTVNVSALLGYERDPACTGGAPVACIFNPDNKPTAPTAEHWICDLLSQNRFGAKSCYFTGYLPRADRYADVDNMLVLGAINETIQSDILEDEDITVLGDVSYIKARNQIFEAATRLTLGQNPSGNGFLSGLLASNNENVVRTLMGGNLLFVQGDLIIPGSSGYQEKTIVVMGGDVYIAGNISEDLGKIAAPDKVGIVVLKKDGVGGNVYVAPEVTDLWANFFLDGSFYSYSGSAADISASGVPIWASEDVRAATLKNQLYIFGSVVSRNTVGGAADLGTIQWEIGDGTLTNDYRVAREHDLNKLRQYRLCYPIDDAGNVLYDEPIEPCGEGEILSDYYYDTLFATGVKVYAPVVIEYSPPSATLPVFSAVGLPISTE